MKIQFDREGKRYIKIEYLGIPRLWLFTTNTKFSFFGKEKTPYISLDEAIRITKEFLKDYEEDTKIYLILKNNISVLEKWNNEILTFESEGKGVKQ